METITCKDCITFSICKNRLQRIAIHANTYFPTLLRMYIDIENDYCEHLDSLKTQDIVDIFDIEYGYRNHIDPDMDNGELL